MRVARSYLVSGSVQGVGFRYFAARTAGREDIAGWVRNTPEGTVEIFAEGEHDALERFERAIRTGPSSAEVSDVRTTEKQPTGHMTGFNIR